MSAKEEREKRLAAALRDNLRRRKAADGVSSAGGVSCEGDRPSAKPAERDREAEEDRD